MSTPDALAMRAAIVWAEAMKTHAGMPTGHLNTLLAAARQREAMGTAPQESAEDRAMLARGEIPPHIAAPHSELIADMKRWLANHAYSDGSGLIRMALKALLSAQQQPPREPTEAMIEAALLDDDDSEDQMIVRMRWRAMWDAAQQQQKGDTPADAFKRMAERRKADEADIRIICGDPMQSVQGDSSGG